MKPARGEHWIMLCKAVNTPGLPTPPPERGVTLDACHDCQTPVYITPGSLGLARRQGFPHRPVCERCGVTTFMRLLLEGKIADPGPILLDPYDPDADQHIARLRRQAQADNN